MPVPYRFETSRLVIRCFEPVDAPLLQTAVNESREHLGPWLPAAQIREEPLALRVQRLRVLRAHYDLDMGYTLGVFDPEETCVLGVVGLHKEGPSHRLEIGYWVHQHHVGKGYITESVHVLTYAAFSYFCVTEVDIRCDPKNKPSYAVAERCGFTHIETLPSETLNAQGKPRDTMIWRKEKEPNVLLPFDINVYDAARSLLRNSVP